LGTGVITGYGTTDSLTHRINMSPVVDSQSGGIYSLYCLFCIWSCALWSELFLWHV